MPPADASITRSPVHARLLPQKVASTLPIPSTYSPFGDCISQDIHFNPTARKAAVELENMPSVASTWASPPTRTPLIENLVSGVGAHLAFFTDSDTILILRRTDRYNPNNVGILEDYLYHQIRSEEYDCLANLAILKLCVIALTSYYGQLTWAPTSDISSTQTCTMPML